MFRRKRMEYEELIEKLQEKYQSAKKKLQENEKTICFLHAEVKRRENKICELEEEIELMKSVSRMFLCSIFIGNQWDNVYGTLYPVIQPQYDPDGRRVYEKACEKLGLETGIVRQASAATYRSLFRSISSGRVEDMNLFKTDLQQEVVKDWLEENGLLPF